MKKLFLFLGLFCLTAGQLDAAAKKRKAAKEDKLTEFFEMIPKAFVLQSGATINQSNFEEASKAMGGKIMKTCSEEMQAQIGFLLTVNYLKSESPLLVSILEGKKKDLSQIKESELFAEITLGQDKMLLVQALFIGTLFQDQQAKNVRAFLKRLFESEASGKTTLLGEKWKEKENGHTLLKLVIDFVICSKQEEFFFPLFAKLIEKKKIKPEDHGITRGLNLGSTESLFEWMVSKYLDFFNHLFSEKKEIGEAKEVVNAYQQLFDQVIDPNISEYKLQQIVEKIQQPEYEKKDDEGKSQQIFERRYKAMEELYKKIMQIQCKAFNVESLNVLLHELMYELGQENQDQAYIKRLFGLVEDYKNNINLLPKNQNKNEYSKMLRSIVMDGHLGQNFRSLLERRDEGLVGKVQDLIEELVTLGADINYVPEQPSSDEFPFNKNSLLYYAVKENVKNIYDFLVHKGAKFTDEEKREGSEGRNYLVEWSIKNKWSVRKELDKP